MLQQKWVVMAGDSITRFMFAALLRLLAEDGVVLLISMLACAFSMSQGRERPAGSSSYDP